MINKTVRLEEEQDDFESRRLWSKVTKGLRTGNVDLATQEKMAIESNQRELIRIREEENVEWSSRFFNRSGANYELDIG
ncbi:hypothetical protein HDU76_002199 [Blyttiomyces sp. JEL0837]|nr:hypothetical protein HDU76_002199 [Blyttiomyces sp. JEL0837]